MLNGVAEVTARPMKFKEDRTMKKRTIIMAALLAVAAWTGCQNTLEVDDPAAREEKPVAARDSVMLTIEAGKSASTKALELVDEGQTLNAFWAPGETVHVISSSETSIGTLTATPKTDATKATLSGSINAEGLEANQTLTLLFPKATWSYDNQGGTLSSIASNFDFARTQVTIESITSSQITTTKSVTFENQQSIYRFGFRHGAPDGPTIRTETLKLTSNRGQLAKTVNAVSGATTAVFSASVPLTVNLSPALTAEQATANTLIYVAIRNGNTSEDDTFSFEIYDNDGATYRGSKTIPSTSLSKPFVSAKNVAMSRLELSQYSTSVAIAL